MTTSTLLTLPPIAKTAQSQIHLRRPVLGFPSARDGFEALIRACGLTAADNVLLPSFIGWSAREGSGVFDPIVNTGVQPVFYRMTEDLLIDVDDAKKKIRETAPRMLVLIHYFGYPDPHAALLAQYARQQGLIVVEDEAHAMLSDLVGNVCGRWGDAAFISLHKMLPFADGGALVLNPTLDEKVRQKLSSRAADQSQLLPFWEYDLSEIAEARKRNAAQLLAALPGMAGRVRLLRPSLDPGVVPQTLPIVIQRKDRNELYFQLNECGFGVVSLYHTMIDRIAPTEFPEAHALARSIMNLPVHQDIAPEQIAAMLDKLQELV